MAIGKKTGGRDIKPGQVLNPKGGLKKDFTLEKAKMLTQKELTLVINKLSDKTKEELKEIIEAKDTKMLECIIGNVMYKAMTKGDMSSFELVLNRAIGKPKDKVLFETQDANPYEGMTLEDIKEARKKLQDRKKDILGE